MYACWLQLENNMQGGSTLSLTMIVFSIVEIKISFETIWQVVQLRRENRQVWKINLEKIRPVANYGKGKRSDKFGKSLFYLLGFVFSLKTLRTEL